MYFGLSRQLKMLVQVLSWVEQASRTQESYGIWGAGCLGICRGRARELHSFACTVFVGYDPFIISWLVSLKPQNFCSSRIATKVRSWNLGLSVFWFWLNVFENSCQCGFPLIDMSPWPLIIQRTEKQSGERVLSKTTLKEGRKEGRKGKEKESMTLREEYSSLGRKVPPDCILFFFLKVLWEDIQNTPWFEMSALLNFRNLPLGAIWTLQGRRRPWISPQHTETDSQVPGSP